MDGIRRIVDILHVLFRSPEDEVLLHMSNNMDLLDTQFGYDYVQYSPCICMKMLEQVKHNHHIFHPEKIVELILNGKCSHVTSKCNPRFIRQAKTSFLIISCILQKLKVVKFLLENNVLINQKTLAMSLTPLHAAILTQNVELFNFLLQAGADVNATCIPCTTKVSSLMLAILEGAEDILRILLSLENTNKHYINSQSKTALCCAAEVNSIKFVDMLIQAGLKATNVTVCKAVQTDNADLLQLVISSRRYFVPQIQTYALHTAVKLGNRKMLKLLLERGFHFNHGTNTLYDQESLHLAVLRNDSEMVKLLLNHQIMLDYELDGFTALDWAVLMDYDKIVEMVKNEYRLRCIKPRDNTHIRFIIEAMFGRDGINRSDVIRKIVSKGFSVNAYSKMGLSMLHEAVFDHDSDAVKTLLELGANPDIKTLLKPITPLFEAVSIGNIAAAKLLLDANASLDVLVQDERESEIDPDEFDLIVPPSEIPLQRSMLCEAVCKNLVDMVYLLLSCGYNVQAENRMTLEWMIEKTKSPEIGLWLSSSMSNPNSLLLCCRDQIRNQWKYNLKQFVDNQCIPQHLKDKLTLKDLLQRNFRISQKFCHWKNFY